MTALPIPRTVNAGSPPAIDDTRWIALNEAAERLSRDPAHLRRLAREQLVGLGLAVKQAAKADEPERWYIARRWNLALSPGQAGDTHRAPELSDFPRHKVREALDKVAVLQAYRELKGTIREAVSSWLPQFIAQQQERYPDLKFTGRTLRRWDKDYQGPADLPKLIDTRGGNQTEQADPAAWDYFKALYLNGNSPATKQCWQQTRHYAKQAGMSWCSYRACCAQLDSKISPEQAALYRSPKDYKDRFEAPLKMDPDTFAPGLCWIGDHAQLDVYCRSGQRKVRPYLTAWQDWKSRKIVGWELVEIPDAMSILTAFRRAILDPSNHGGPDYLWQDNGRDFDATMLVGSTKQHRRVDPEERLRLRMGESDGLYGYLKIGVISAIPYNSKAKGRLERWFRRFHNEHDKTYESYTGSKTEDKPERLKGLLKEPWRLPTFEQLRESIGEYIQHFNASAEHAKEDLRLPDGRRCSPDEMMARCPRVRSYDRKAIDLLLRAQQEPRAVTKEGVKLRVAGGTTAYGVHDSRIRSFIGTGRKVRLTYDPQDTREVHAWTEDWKWIGELKNNRFGNVGTAVSIADLKESIAEHRKHKKTLRDIDKDRLKHVLRRPDELAVGIAKRKTEPLEAPTIQPVLTPLDAQASRAGRDIEQTRDGRFKHVPMPDLSALLKRAEERDAELAFDFEAHAKAAGNRSKPSDGAGDLESHEPDTITDPPENILDRLARVYGNPQYRDPEELDLRDSLRQPRVVGGGAA